VVESAASQDVPGALTATTAKDGAAAELLQQQQENPLEKVRSLTASAS
jgi:hypothetical protein